MTRRLPITTSIAVVLVNSSLNKVSLDMLGLLLYMCATLYSCATTACGCASSNAPTKLWPLRGYPRKNTKTSMCSMTELLSGMKLRFSKAFHVEFDFRVS